MNVLCEKCGQPLVAHECPTASADAELLDWMQKTTWIIEINDSKMGGHVVKTRHRKYTAPTLREALTEAMRDNCLTSR